MSSRRPDATPRRTFLGQIAATAVLAGTAGTIATPAEALASGPVGRTTRRSAPPFDDSWTAKVQAAKHRAVFDSPEVSDGSVADQAYVFMGDYKKMYDAADADLAAVLVMRHMGVVLAFNDHLWDRYELGKQSKVKDPTTGKAARRNPLEHAAEDDKYALVSPDGTLSALRQRGAILLACNRATMYFASMMAKKTKQPLDQVKSEFRANLVDGVLLQPSGIFAVLRAQEAGATYMRSS